MKDLLTPKEELVLLAKDLGIPFPSPTPYTLDYTRLLLHSVKEWMRTKYKAFPTAEIRKMGYRDSFCAKIIGEDGSVLWGEFSDFDTAYLTATLAALKGLNEDQRPNIPLSIKVGKFI